MRAFKTYSLSNFQIPNAVLITLVTMLYITSPGLIYFITGYVYLLTLFTHFSVPGTSPLATTNLLCIYELGFCF